MSSATQLEKETVLRREYRLDVQGIRVLGAVLIMLFHIWFNKVSGGVDIFFVISGYLMMILIASDYSKFGNSSVLIFWARILKRITPSAILILSTTGIAGYFILPPTIVEPFLEEIIASFFHLENIKLILNSVDYLAREFPPSPVQQFWALSIQVQFYLIFPLIVFTTFKFFGKEDNFYRLKICLIVFSLSSFAFSLYFTHSDPSAAYFHPFTRFWEFLVGALISLYSLQVTHKSTSSKRNILSVLGFSLVLISAFAVPESANYPGFVALIPVAAASMLLIAGSDGVVNRLLAKKWWASMGKYSFTVYLWHWPILVFYRELNGDGSISILGGAGIILLSVTFALITTRVVENRLKSISELSWFKVCSATSVLILIFSGITYSVLYEYREIKSNVYINIDSEEVVPIALDRIYQQPMSKIPSRKELVEVRWKRPKSIRQGCQQSALGNQLIICEYGDRTSQKLIVLAGSSHSAQWMFPVERFAAREGYRLAVITKAGCTVPSLLDGGASCEQWNKSLMEYLADVRPIALISNATVTRHDSVEVVPKHWKSFWKSVTNLGISVIGIRDNPRRKDDATLCISRNRKNFYESCSISKQNMMSTANLEESVSIYTIDMTPFLCSSAICPPVFDNKIIIRDSHHVSETYVKYISNAFEQKLAQFFDTLER